MNNFVEQLKKLREEDKTAWLDARKKILEYFFASSSQSVRDMLYAEFNRFSKDINECSEQERETHTYRLRMTNRKLWAKAKDEICHKAVINTYVIGESRLTLMGIPNTLSVSSP